MINFLYRNHFWNVVPQISINILTKGNMQEIVTYRFNNKSLTNMLMKSWSWKKYIIKMGMNSKAVFYTIKLQALCNHSYINMYRQIRLIFYTWNNENVSNNTCRAKHPITWTVSIFSTIVSPVVMVSSIIKNYSIVSELFS